MNHTATTDHAPQSRGFALLLLVILHSSFVIPSHAGPRTSASYSITTDTADSGGTHTTSAAYANDASAGSVTGLSTVASPNQIAKHGYLGQLYEVTALQLVATPLTLNETATLQLGASLLLDDATTLNPAASSVSWSVLSGPITSINASGLATAGVVPQDTPARVQGILNGLTAALNLTVLDTLKDNFGSYAGDGLDDAWQVQYFGVNNPNAAPSAINDGSGLSNLFKYIAGLIPNNSASTFVFRAQPVTNQPGQKRITFGPTFSDRHYTLFFSTDLAAWSTLTGPFAGSNGTTNFTDPNAGGPRKFYRVQISNP